MNRDDNPQDPELLERFKRASEGAPAAPSDAVRAAILAEGRRIAAARRSTLGLQAFDASQPAANDARWRLTVYGTAGAAVLAALLIAPRLWDSAPPPASQAPAATAAVSQSALQRAPEALAFPKSESSWSLTQDKRRAPAAQKPAPPSAQNRAPPDALMVTQSRRAQNYPAPAAMAAAPAADAAESAVLAGAPADAATISAARAARSRSAPRAVTLSAAVQAGNITQTSDLLDQGAAADAADELGRTPLMLAVENDQIAIVRLLLSRGADPNIADKRGRTPLALAEQNNQREMTRLLKQAGAR